MKATVEPPAIIAFGRFQILPRRRELLADGQPIKLGGRAFDVLIALIEARGGVVSKDVLMARVWPGQAVDESNLRTHISDLRSAFGAEHELIRTVSRRGYQFAGEIRVSPQRRDECSSPGALRTAPGADLPPTNLPHPVSELIGRESELREIMRLTTEHRLVTLTGPGGIGKTRLAVATARSLLPQFAEGAWLAEFSPLSDPGLVPATVAAAAGGIEVSAGEISAQRVAQVVSERPLLLVLDTCEHVIGIAAELAEAVLQAGSAIHIIATSREPLLVEGEQIYKVPPLAVPATVGEDVWQCSSVQLFAVRARARGAHFPEHQHVTLAIAAICRQLDGIPLAIELAAARAATFGIEGTAARLDDRFRLLGGRRTAPPRHQTLRALLDWSYELLGRTERLILNRLAIFAGLFGLEAASAIAACPETSPSEVVERLANLAAKSLILAVDGRVAKYRLLDTTRAYALEKLRESGEFETVARRHAEYYRDLFEQADAEWQTRPAADWLAEYAWRIDNLRAALDWAFSREGDASIGVGLTAAAVPLWMHLSLNQECRGRVERALAVLTVGAERDPRREMELQAALAVSLLYAGGVAVPEIDAAWMKALEIAESLDDAEYQLRSLWGLWVIHITSGRHRSAWTLAQRFGALAARRPDSTNRLVGELMLGLTQQYLGDQKSAREHLERALADHVTPDHRPRIIGFPVDWRVAARAPLVRALWVGGFPDQAMRMAERAINDARAINHANSLCYALALAACPIALLIGDLAATERYVEMLLDQSMRHGVARWLAFGRRYQGVLAIERCDVISGLRLLRAGFDEFGEAGSTFLRLIAFLMAEALGRAGQVSEGLAAVDEAIARSEHTEGGWAVAELLRVKGELLLLQDAQATAAAEDLFRQALDWARRHGALSWELRAAMSLARLLQDQGRPASAQPVLQSVYDRFTEGFDAVDLKAARTLLDGLRECYGSAASDRLRRAPPPPSDSGGPAARNGVRRGQSSRHP
jgi:predicted ATPase/DNA-binding winged helix-turn-helix (wHTH) protein